MSDDNKKDKKEKRSWRERLTGPFNSASFKSFKKKMVIGGTALTVGAVGIGGAVGGKMLYDDTERTMQIYVESLDSKRTVVERSCETRTVTTYQRNGNEEEKIEKDKCDQDVLNRIIRTPQGVFANNPSKIDMKTKNEAETIDSNLKPGAWYEVVVKGWDMMGPPNIMSAERLPNNWREMREQKANGVDIPAEFGAGDQTSQAGANEQNAQEPVSGSTLEELERQLKILKLQEELKQLENGGATNDDGQTTGQQNRNNSSTPKP